MDKTRLVPPALAQHENGDGIVSTVGGSRRTAASRSLSMITGKGDNVVAWAKLTDVW